MSNKAGKEHWHPGFVGAIELEFRNYKEDLDFESEHQLSKEPLKIDLLIIKKRKNTVIKNQIGAFFRQHNIFEFKSPRDALSIDDYIKTIGYACLYKGLGKYVDEIPFTEMTVTLVRDTMPKGLFQAIHENGGTVEEQYPGVFYINGFVNIPTQFILTSKLDPDLHSVLRLLTEHAQEEDIVKFLNSVVDLQDPGDRQNIDAVLTVSSSVNNEVFEKVERRGEKMNDFLRGLIKDEIQEEKQKAIDTTLVTAIKNLMKNMGMDSQKAMDVIGVSPADQIRYASLL